MRSLITGVDTALRIERRESPRERYAELRIGFLPMWRAPSPEATRYGLLVNSNRRGVCIEVSTPLRLEQVLKLSLPLVEQKTTVSTLGEVRWVKRKAVDEEEYLIGVRYLL